MRLPAGEKSFGLLFCCLRSLFPAHQRLDHVTKLTKQENDKKLKLKRSGYDHFSQRDDYSVEMEDDEEGTDGS